MAECTQDIGSIVKKCNVLLLDIEGTTTSISFVKDKLFPYAEENVKKYLDSQWEDEDVKEVVAALRKLAIEDQEKSVSGVVAIPSEDSPKEEQIEGIVNSVKWQMSADRKVGPLKQIQGLIWKQGYDNGEIKGHVYEDVSPALEQWRSVEGNKVYIYSSGSVQAQKLLFGKSQVGDLLVHINGHFDTAVGAKQEAGSYKNIVEKIDCKPEEILFLTDILKEAEAAREGGLQAALVSREGNAPLPENASFPVLHSLAQLAATNKRKPQAQDEQPAKIPKTSNNETTVIDTDTVIEIDDKVETKQPESPDVMEVDGENIAPEVNKVPEVQKSKPVAEVVTIVEVISETSGSTESSPVNIEPVVMEVEDVEESESKTKKPDETDNTKAIDKTETTKTETIVSVEKSEKVEEAVVIKTKEQTENPKITEETNKGKVETEITKSAEDTVKEKITEKTEITVKITAEGTNIKKSEDDIMQVETETEKAEENEDKVVEGVVITEVEDVNDKANEEKCDVDPIIEEPSDSMEATDIEELKNVGDVLEEECKEILSKVNDVTNLDSITVKPVLTSILEENGKSNGTESVSDIPEQVSDPDLVSKDDSSIGIGIGAIEKDAKNELKTAQTIDNTDNGKTEVKELEGKKASKTENNDSCSKNEKPATESTVPVEVNETKTEKTTPVTENGHVNGNAASAETNGTKVNGDAVNKEPVSRLTAENGETRLNGTDVQTVGEESKAEVKEAVVEEIKVKPLPSDEKPQDPIIEQATEA